MIPGEPTLAAQIARGVAEHAANEVVFATADGVREVTLAELAADAERVAGALQGQGIGPGDVVAVQLASTYEGTVAQAAVAMCGAVLLPIVQIYGPRELAFILAQSQAVALVVPETARGRAHAAPLFRGMERPAGLRHGVRRVRPPATARRRSLPRSAGSGRCGSGWWSTAAPPSVRGW